jgi:hypothetical protein
VKNGIGVSYRVRRAYAAQARLSAIVAAEMRGKMKTVLVGAIGFIPIGQLLLACTLRKIKMATGMCNTTRLIGLSSDCVSRGGRVGRGVICRLRDRFTSNIY